MKTTSTSPHQTIKIAADFAKNLEPGRIVGLIGDLGAGKTTFVQGMARGLGIDPEYYVNSPTFTMINEYCGRRVRASGAASAARSLRLIHIDLYRIDKPIEGETLGLDEYLASGAVVAVEWIERMPELEKRMTDRVEIVPTGPESREILIESIP
jgi:tRNA threonylcarbamoyladenosine biosynthesis protein TsaE